jgi:hypothetical protein
MLVLRRDCAAVIDIAPEECAALREELGRLVPALARLFQPDQFNSAFLMNVDEWADEGAGVVGHRSDPRQCARGIFLTWGAANPCVMSRNCWQRVE